MFGRRRWKKRDKKNVRAVQKCKLNGGNVVRETNIFLGMGNS